MERRRWSVTGLFYGDASQLVAQLVGISTLLGFVFTFSFIVNLAIEFFVGQRVSVETEVAGLDLPEMGQLGIPSSSSSRSLTFCLRRRRVTPLPSPS